MDRFWILADHKDRFEMEYKPWRMGSHQRCQKQRQDRKLMHVDLISEFLLLVDKKLLL